MWVHKYNPSTLDDYIGDDHLKNTIQEILDTKDTNNLLFYGKAGRGKTSLAKLISYGITSESNVLYLNASDERGLETIRNKIIPHVTSVSMTSLLGEEVGLKMVILDEADQLTPAAQASLKNLIESVYDNARFILTCNDEHKIIPPLKSRCTPLSITPHSKKAVGQRVADILKLEQIKHDVEDVAKVVNDLYPDIRGIINTLEVNTNGGVLSLDCAIKNDKLEESIPLLSSKPTFKKIKEYSISLGVKNQEDIFGFLYENIFELPLDPSESLSIISENLYRYSQVHDKEIVITYMLNELKKK